MNTEAVEPKGVSDKSPFAGCAIFLTVLLVVVFLIVFSVVVMLRQSEEIEKFTETKPAKVQVESIVDREPELNGLAEKIERFRVAVLDGKSATLELNANEMNLAIASYDAFKDLRGNVRIREITGEQMKLDISFKLNGKPRIGKKGEGGWVASDPRYLNGVMTAKPALLSKEVVLKVQDMDVSFAKVPREFIERLSPYQIASTYAGESEIGKVMSALTNVELGAGVVRFVKEEGEIPKDTVTKEEVDKSSQRLFTFLGIAASIFLFFVALILFLGVRAKKRQETLKGPDEPA